MSDEDKKTWEKRLGFLEQSLEGICERQEEKARSNNNSGWGSFKLYFIQNKNPFFEGNSIDFSDEIKVQRNNTSIYLLITAN